MPAPWKLVLIGGEITVLAAFTGLGLHLAIQPHRHALVAPPSLLLPVAPPPAPRPSAIASAPAPRPVATAAGSLNADWITGLGRSDRRLAAGQWDILQALIGGVERYLRDRVVPEMERRR
jgi:hypothetical protein